MKFCYKLQLFYFIFCFNSSNLANNFNYEYEYKQKYMNKVYILVPRVDCRPC